MTAPTAPPVPAEPTPDGVAAAGARPGRAAIGAWLVFAGATTALDGLVGLGVAVLVAAVLLAGLPRRLLAALGIVSLLGVPASLLIRGLPAPSEVSPFFVAGSLWPHHLAFAGIVLVGTWAVLDLRGRLSATTTDEVPAVPARPRPAVGLAIVAGVAVAALVATLAVLQT